MRFIRRSGVMLLACMLISGAYGQRTNLEPNRPGQKPVPTVTFQFAFRGANPAYYAVAVESDGRAAYRATELGSGNTLRNGAPYMEEFTISAPTRTRIFHLARRANYFQGNFEGPHRVAYTGTKTLTYSEGPAVWFAQPTTGVRNTTTYDYSDDPAIQQLTATFEGIANTLELGRRLDQLRRSDGSGLDSELKRAEKQVQQNRLQELRAIVPSLRAVANDNSVVESARRRAQHLLALAQAG